MVLIAAGGNVINDYFDQKIDRINKPKKQLVGRTVTRRIAMTGHLVLTIGGVLLATFVAWRVGHWKYLFIHVVAAALLWGYSADLKRRLLIGNIVVALLAGIVPLLVGLYDIPLLRGEYSYHLGMQMSIGPMNVFFSMLWAWIIAYAVFAFLSTLAREIVKDIADVDGDEEAGCKTIPISWGIDTARIIATFIIVMIIGALLQIRSRWLDDDLSFWYIGLAVVLPLLGSLAFLWPAKDREGFVRSGIVLKIAMVTAIGYACLLNYTM